MADLAMATSASPSPHPSPLKGEGDRVGIARRTLMVMAGGTGGHVYPALAVADALRARGWNVFWLGTKSGLEARVVPAAGIDMVWVAMGGVRGKGLVKKLLLPAMLLVAFWQSLRAIFARRPDVVLGMGGYTAFPGGMMASLLNKPLVIHEQNSVGGLTNRVLACLADRVLTAFPQAFRSERDKPIPCRSVTTEWVGNPVRTDIAALGEEARPERSGPLRLLVVGGSLGAQPLNRTLPAALAQLDAAERPRVTHQSGERWQAEVAAAYAAAGVEAEVLPFIDDMPRRLAEADLVVCRAGAITVSELCAAGVPAVLVPFVVSTTAHQRDNARHLAQHGAAIHLPQDELTPERLAELLREGGRERWLPMAERARALARPRAAARVADEIERLGGR